MAQQQIIFRADRLLVALSGRGDRASIETIKDWGSSVDGLWEPEQTPTGHFDKSQINRIVSIALQYLEFHSHIAIDWLSRNVAVMPTTWVSHWPDSQGQEESRWHLVGARSEEHVKGLASEQMYVDHDFELRNIARDYILNIRLPDLLTYQGDPTNLFDAETLGDDVVPGAWCHAASLGSAQELVEELSRGMDLDVSEATSAFKKGQFLNVERGRFTRFDELPGGASRRLEDYRGDWLLRRRLRSDRGRYEHELLSVNDVDARFVRFRRIKVPKELTWLVAYNAMPDSMETFVFNPNEQSVSHLYTLKIPLPLRRALIMASGTEPSVVKQDSRYWMTYHNIHPLLALRAAEVLSVEMVTKFSEVQ